MSDTCEFFNIRDEYKSLPLEEVKNIQKRDSLPYSIALLNFSGSLNVGMCIRTAVIFGASRVYVIGKKRYDRRSTVGAHNYVDVKFIEKDPDDSPAEILDVIGQDYNPLFVEQGGVDISFQTYGNWMNPMCFIFGCEGRGISDKFINAAFQPNERPRDRIVSIPQIGVLRSLNVAAVCAIVCHKVAGDMLPISTL